MQPCLQDGDGHGRALAVPDGGRGAGQGGGGRLQRLAEEGGGPGRTGRDSLCHGQEGGDLTS